MPRRLLLELYGVLQLSSELCVVPVLRLQWQHHRCRQQKQSAWRSVFSSLHSIISAHLAHRYCDARCNPWHGEWSSCCLGADAGQMMTTLENRPATALLMVN